MVCYCQKHVRQNNTKIVVGVPETPENMPSNVAERVGGVGSPWTTPKPISLGGKGCTDNMTRYRPLSPEQIVCELDWKHKSRGCGWAKTRFQVCLTPFHAFAQLYYQGVKLSPVIAQRLSSTSVRECKLSSWSVHATLLPGYILGALRYCSLLGYKGR